MDIPSKSFQQEHISTYQKYVGKPLNVVDENGIKTVPEDHREAQAIIKDAHRLIKEWTIGVKNRLFPDAPDPEKTITATNQRGNFRDYLPQTIYPSNNSPSLLMYWFYLWSDRSTPENKIYFRLLIGLNEDRSDTKLIKKLEEIRARHGDLKAFEPMLDGFEGARMSMDELINWAINEIKNYPLTYDQIAQQLEPELSENENRLLNEQKESSGFWVEKTLVKGRQDRLSGDNALGVSLWSPQKGANGRNIYKSMLDVKPGDIIFHFTDNKSIVGISIAADKADDKFMCIEETDWAGQPGYRIPLRDYVQLDPVLPRESIFRNQSALLDIYQKNTGLFYNKDLDLNQGKYLTQAPEQLVQLFSQTYHDDTGKDLPYINFKSQKNMANKISTPYDINQAVDRLLISKEEFITIKDLLEYKKNLILQGPPGVGKSFVAKRLAYALLGEKDDDRVESIQFHQSFSYEDFIQGYRPKKDSSGFHLKNGIFYSFCQKAKQDLSRPYVFVIDEINRGNLSKIFGEVMLLIESDKRKESWAVKLTYSEKEDPKFYIPENVFILGMMNTADRSLAIVDYALRRRFVFKDVSPGFENPNFEHLLLDKGVSKNIINKITDEMAQLNNEIENSLDLGTGFLIGHSYFIPDIQITDSEEWYNRIIDNEIGPLCREYWFDKKKSDIDQKIYSMKAM